MSTKKILGYVIALGLLLTQFISTVSGSVDQEKYSPDSGSNGPQTDAIVISDMALDSKNPAVAYNSTRDQYLVVWYNDRPGNDDIQAQRLDKNGKLVGSRFFISAGPDHERSFPDVAYDSTNDQYLVVWMDYATMSLAPGRNNRQEGMQESKWDGKNGMLWAYIIKGRRVSGDGRVLDRADLLISSNEVSEVNSEPAVAYADKSDRFLVVWHKDNEDAIYGQIIGADGSLLARPILIPEDLNNVNGRSSPDVAFHHETDRFLVVFGQQMGAPNYENYIYGQFISGKGSLLQPNFQIEANSYSNHSPKVVPLSYSRDEEIFLVTYEHNTSGPAPDIFGRRIKANGTTGSLISIANKVGVVQNHHSVAFNKSTKDILVTWTEPNPKNTVPYVSIFGDKITEDGTIIENDLYVSGEFSDYSAIAAGKMGDYLIVHQDEHFGFHILGVLYRVIDWQIFQDVGGSHWAFSWINRLYAAGVTSGCTQAPLNYCPEQTVTRAEMAKFLLKGVHGPAYEPPPVGGNTGFADVSPSNWAAAWIKQLAAEGITSGCGGGNYCPNAQVTRAEMAKFLLAAKHGVGYNPPPVGGSTGFNDVSPGYWAAAWIKQLSAEGITSGCGGGNYCPDGQVTRAEMAKFLINTFALP